MNWPLELLDKLKGNRKVIRCNPWVFIETWMIVAILSGGLTWTLISVRISNLHSLLEVQKERNKNLEERNTTLKETIEEYRERLGLVNPVRDRFAALSHAELKKHCLDIVARFRQVLTNDEAKRRQESNKIFHAQSQAASDDEILRLVMKHADVWTQSSLELWRQYTSEFQVNFVLCRNELAKRLPRESGPKLSSGYYDSPVNPFMYNEVASEVERLARLLSGSTS